MESLVESAGPIVIDHALDVARGHRTQPQGTKIAQQSHGHARLVAVGVGNDDAGCIGFGLKDGANQRVELGIDQHHMFAMGESVQNHVGRGFDRSRNFDQYVDGIAGS
jgi:hypothetical protein